MHYDLNALGLWITVGAGFVIAGVQQAGWKHRLLISGFIGFGCVCILAALAWPLLYATLPGLARFMSDAATPSTWLVFILLVAAYALLGPQFKAQAPGKQPLKEIGEQGNLISLRNQIQPLEADARSANLDLLYLFDWARNIEMVLLIPLLIETRPKADALTPPVDNAKRAELEKEMRRWASEVISTLRYLVRGDDVRRAMQSAQNNAEHVVRTMPPNSRPSGVDPIAFHDFFIMAAQCDAAEQSLLRLMEDRRDLTLSTLSELTQRYSNRQ